MSDYRNRFREASQIAHLAEQFARNEHRDSMEYNERVAIAHVVRHSSRLLNLYADQLELLKSPKEGDANEAASGSDTTGD